MNIDRPGFVTYNGYTYKMACQSVGKGWRTLIRTLWRFKPEDVLVVQVKEKFGGLRFYLSSAPNWYHDLVGICETASYYRCENCGKQGEVQLINGWYKTACKKCAVKRKNKEWMY